MNVFVIHIHVCVWLHWWFILTECKHTCGFCDVSVWKKMVTLSDSQTLKRN